MFYADSSAGALAASTAKELSPHMTAFKLRPGAKVLRMKLDDSLDWKAKKAEIRSRLRDDFADRGLPDEKFDVSHELMMQGYDAVWLSAEKELVVLNNRAILGRKSTYLKKYDSPESYKSMNERMAADHKVWASKKENGKYLSSDGWSIDPFPASDYPDVLDEIKGEWGEVLADTIEVK